MEVWLLSVEWDRVIMKEGNGMQTFGARKPCKTRNGTQRRNARRRFIERTRTVLILHRSRRCVNTGEECKKKRQWPIYRNYPVIWKELLTKIIIMWKDRDSQAGTKQGASRMRIRRWNFRRFPYGNRLVYVSPDKWKIERNGRRSGRDLLNSSTATNEES
jgi:hypothetical protein